MELNLTKQEAESQEAYLWRLGTMKKNKEIDLSWAA
jgi:hypothetical protein